MTPVVWLYGVQGGDKPAGNSNLFDVDFGSLPRQLQLRLKVAISFPPVFHMRNNLVLS